MAAELSLVPDPSPGDGDGGDGSESNLGDLIYLAERLLTTAANKIDWLSMIDELKPAAKALTDDEADYSTLVYLMTRASVEFEVTIEGVEDLS